jgi:hypothetical protein
MCRTAAAERGYTFATTSADDGIDDHVLVNGSTRIAGGGDHDRDKDRVL